MRSVALVVLCACNPLFGLDRTTQAPPIDAQYFDAGLDAPFTCWAPHADPPMFSTSLHEVIQPTQCSEYTVAGGWATALCFDPETHMTEISEGAIDAPLTSVAALAPTAGTSFDTPRQAPEGSLVFLRRTMAAARSIVAYRREAGVWTSAFTVVPPLGTFERFGTPSAGPKRRMMIVGGTALMREVEIDNAGTMTDVRVYDGTNFPFNGLPQPPNLSADGLRMIVYGGIDNAYAMYVLDRERLDQAFQHRPLVMPTVYDAFLTSDCGRIYFSDGGLGKMFYLRRE